MISGLGVKHTHQDDVYESETHGNVNRCVPVRGTLNSNGRVKHADIKISLAKVCVESLTD